MRNTAQTGAWIFANFYSLMTIIRAVVTDSVRLNLLYPFTVQNDGAYCTAAHREN